MKKYTVAHGHKTQNLIINLDHDDWILSDLDATLASVGCGEYEYEYEHDFELWR
jgi:hypothetical protein